MTAADRIFLRRHYQAFSSLVPGNKITIRRAVVRVAHGFGISARDLAWWFDVSRDAISNDLYGRYERRAILQRWKEARQRVERARVELAQAEGRERAAAERARLRGLELTERGVAA